MFFVDAGQLVVVLGFENSELLAVRGAGVGQFAVDGLDGGVGVVAVVGGLREPLFEAGDHGVGIGLDLREFGGGPVQLRVERSGVGEFVEGCADLRGDGGVLFDARGGESAQCGDRGGEVRGRVDRCGGSVSSASCSASLRRRARSRWARTRSAGESYLRGRPTRGFSASAPAVGSAFVVLLIRVPFDRLQPCHKRTVYVT